MLSPYRDIPTPAGSMLLAQTKEWLHPERAPHLLDKYAVEIGPLVRFRVGPLRMLLVNEPSLINEVVHSEAFNTKGRFYSMVRLVLNNIVSANGENWESRRKLYIAALRGIDVFEATHQACSLLEQRWSGRYARNVDLEPSIWRLCSDMCMWMAVGEFPSESFYADAAVLQGEMGGLAPDLAFRPLAVVSPLRWRTLRGVRARLVAYFEERLDRRLAGQSSSEGSRDLLDGLIGAVDDPYCPEDRAAIVAGLMDFFFTSDDVAACALRWAVWMVARHRDVQQELREELSHVISPGERVGREHLEDLPGLARVARECLRLYPGYGLFGRFTTEPTPLGGYLVPGGVEVLMSPYVLHRSEEHWDKPDLFLPSRWDGVGTHTPGVDPARPAYMPFGFGRRSCLARHLGWSMVCVGLARIFSRFSLDARNGHLPKEEFWGTLHSANGLPVQVYDAPSLRLAASA